MTLDDSTILDRVFMHPSIVSDLRSTFGDHMQENMPLSGYTAARIGGPADI